mmetsp:Transcript_71328/g.221234  ORF Transcript_71328/g.221234 Transcript_71328/m.221234 type:complete len:283 (+) Transcript_71328:264-1112(+)
MQERQLPAHRGDGRQGAGEPLGGLLDLRGGRTPGHEPHHEPEPGDPEADELEGFLPVAAHRPGPQHLRELHDQPHVLLHAGRPGPLGPAPGQGVGSHRPAPHARARRRLPLHRRRAGLPRGPQHGERQRAVAGQVRRLQRPGLLVPGPRPLERHVVRCGFPDNGGREALPVGGHLPLRAGRQGRLHALEPPAPELHVQPHACHRRRLCGLQRLHRQGLRAGPQERRAALAATGDAQYLHDRHRRDRAQRPALRDLQPGPGPWHHPELRDPQRRAALEPQLRS